MTKKIFTFLFGLFFIICPYQGVFAGYESSGGSNNGGGASHTISSVTVNGADAYLSVGVVGATSDCNPSVEWNGTTLNELQLQQNNNGSGRYLHLFGNAVNAGTDDISVTSAGCDFLSVNYAVYNNVDSLDTSTKASPSGSVSSHSQAINTAQDDEWIIGFWYTDGSGAISGNGSSDLLFESHSAVTNGVTATTGTTAGTYYSEAAFSSAHVAVTALALIPVSGGGGGGGGGTTTTSSTSVSLDLTNIEGLGAVFLLFFVAWFIMWIFKK